MQIGRQTSGRRRLPMSPMPSTRAGGNSHDWPTLRPSLLFVLSADLMDRCRQTLPARHDGRDKASSADRPHRIILRGGGRPRADDIAGIGNRHRRPVVFSPRCCATCCSPVTPPGILRWLRGRAWTAASVLRCSVPRDPFKCLNGLQALQFDCGDVGIEFIDGSDLFYGRLLRPADRLP